MIQPAPKENDESGGKPAENDLSVLPGDVIVIEPGSNQRIFNLRECWEFRELLLFLAWRDVSIRYKQTMLGGAWAIFQPFMTMLLLSLFLGRLTAVAEPTISYPLFVYAGLLPWMFLSNAVLAAGNSLQSNQNLITKVYFPRIFIPISATSAVATDFLVAFAVVPLLMLIFWTPPGGSIVLLPMMVILLAALALGVGTLLSASSTEFRDVRYLAPFLVQLWMFATPTIYLPMKELAGSVSRWLLPLNPAYGIIYNFRESLLGGTVDVYSLVVSGTVALFCLFWGTRYFHRIERTVADVL